MTTNPPQYPGSTSNPAPAAAAGATSAVARQANSLIVGLARHWLALFNTAWAIYLLLPFLAPVFMWLGWTGPAQVIYHIYSVLCHQLPTHSYFLFGSDPTPGSAELVAAGMSASSNLFVQRVFIGNPEIGWKVAFCERDVAIYAGVLAAGLVYAQVRRRMRPLSFKVFVLFALPMAIDGGTQLFGWRESSWWLRSLTGALFAVGCVWLAYPYVDEAMDDVLVGELQRQAAVGTGESSSPL